MSLISRPGPSIRQDNKSTSSQMQKEIEFIASTLTYLEHVERRKQSVVG